MATRFILAIVYETIKIKNNLELCKIKYLHKNVLIFIGNGCDILRIFIYAFRNLRRLAQFYMTFGGIEDMYDALLRVLAK